MSFWKISYFSTLIISGPLIFQHWGLKETTQTQHHTGVLSSQLEKNRCITAPRLPTCSTSLLLSPRNDSDQRNGHPTVTASPLDCDDGKSATGRYFSLSVFEIQFSVITDDNGGHQVTFFICLVASSFFFYIRVKNIGNERKGRNKNGWCALPPTELYRFNSF